MVENYRRMTEREDGGNSKDSHFAYLCAVDQKFARAIFKERTRLKHRPRGNEGVTIVAAYSFAIGP
jgi:hypothetical protein